LGKTSVDRVVNKNKINLFSLNSIDRLSIVGSNEIGALIYKPENSIADSNDISNLRILEKEVNRWRYF
jgi:hypothetical protein